MKKSEIELIKTFWENPEIVNHRFFELNLIRIFAKKISQKRIAKDKMIYLSILISSGCRASEPITYKIITSDDDCIILEIPILKRKSRATKKVRIKYKLFNLEEKDFKKYQGKMGNYLKYHREFLKQFQINARTYRRYFITWLAQKGIPVSDIRDIVGHSTIAVTDKYLRRMEYDYTSLLSL